MAASTATPQVDVVKLLSDGFTKAEEDACRLVWAALKQAILDHWLIILLLFLVVLSLAIGQYVFTGRWRMLASLLYHCLYFGGVLILLSCCGPEIFANLYIDIILFLLYVICFKVVGIFVDAMGMRERRDRWP